MPPPAALPANRGPVDLAFWWELRRPLVFLLLAGAFRGKVCPGTAHSIKFPCLLPLCRYIHVNERHSDCWDYAGASLLFLRREVAGDVQEQLRQLLGVGVDGTVVCRHNCHVGRRHAH